MIRLLLAFILSLPAQAYAQQDVCLSTEISRQAKYPNIRGFVIDYSKSCGVWHVYVTNRSEYSLLCTFNGEEVLSVPDTVNVYRKYPDAKTLSKGCTDIKRVGRAKAISYFNSEEKAVSASIVRRDGQDYELRGMPDKACILASDDEELLHYAETNENGVSSAFPSDFDTILDCNTRPSPS